MSFTIEEIENALSGHWEHDRGYYSSIKKSGNYTAIVDYLTGKTNTLQTVAHETDYFSWSALLNLLHDIQNPSPNEQLLLNVIHHPHYTTYLEHFYFYWLASYILKHNDQQAFQAALAEMRKLGKTDHDIFSYFTASIHLVERQDYTDLRGTPLTDFLVQYIKGLKQTSRSMLGGYYGWSRFCFQLMDEARPDLVKDYVLQGLHSYDRDLVQFFITYDNGKYVPGILEYVKDPKNDDADKMRSKLGAAIDFYKVDKEKYEGLVIELSHRYLEFYEKHLTKDRWEPGFHLGNIDGTDNSYFPYSVCAIHFLLLYERQKTVVMLQQWQQEKIKLDKTVLNILYAQLKEESFLLLQQAITQDVADIDYLREAVKIVVDKFEPVTFLPVLWTAIGSKSKPMRALVAKNLAAKDTEAESKAIGLLQHKKTEVRQTAALILGYFPTPATRAAIIEVLNKEANDNTRDVLLETVADNLPAAADVDFVHQMVEAAHSRNKLNKPVETWLDDTALPGLYYTSGASLSTAAVRFLLYRMSRVKTMRSDIEARLLLNHIDKERSGDFAMHIIKLFIEKGTKAEYKYLLALAALLGNDAVVDKIRIAINNWIDESRFKMAEYGVGALALQGSNKALRWVEWYSRKYRTKKANVGAAALSALEAAAEELNITPYELGDRIVPDFGFDGLFKNFTIGEESYRAFIDSNFKLAFFNDDNKKLKSLPAAAGNELKEEFKSIAKEVRDVVKSQSSRLEYYLVVQRRWTVAQWQQFFLTNPIMFIYATKLLWGVYDANNTLIQCFYCQEDTTLVDIEDNEIELPGNVQIGIVHPLHVQSGLLQQWKQKFFDLSIDPVFQQLDRPVQSLPVEEVAQTIIHQFKEQSIEGAAITGTLEKRSWRKGPGGDGGMIDCFFKEDYSGHIKAVLEVEGVFVAYFDAGMNAALGRLYFIDTTKEKSRWINFPQSDSDERLVPLGKVPDVFYSEIMADVSAIKLKKTGNAEQS